MRSCVGCGEKDSPEAFVRLVLVPGTPATVVVDAARGGFGRGAYVHARPDCITRACRGGLARSFKGGVHAEPAELGERVAEALDRRVTGLLASARRTGNMIVGADAVFEALRSPVPPPLLVVAADAGSIAQSREVGDVVARGAAVAWGNKVRIGALCGRAEVALVAISHASIAAELARACAGASALRALSVTAQDSREAREVR